MKLSHGMRNAPPAYARSDGQDSEGERMTTEATTTDLHAFTENWLEWYRAQEARLAAPHGFLAITGLHWLDETPQRFPDAPGSWRTGPDGVVVVLDDAEELVVDGSPVRGEHRF